MKFQSFIIELPHLILNGEKDMPDKKLTKFLLLPKLELLKFHNINHQNSVTFYCSTNSKSNFCPHCGLETSKIHDTRDVRILDAPYMGRTKILRIRKKRFRCVGLGC